MPIPTLYLIPTTTSQLESLSKVDFLQVAELFPDILKMLEEVSALTGDEEAEEDHHMEHEVHIVLKAVKVIIEKLDKVTVRLDKIEKIERRVDGAVMALTQGGEGGGGEGA